VYAEVDSDITKKPLTKIQNFKFKITGGRHIGKWCPSAWVITCQLTNFFKLVFRWGGNVAVSS